MERTDYSGAVGNLLEIGLPENMVEPEKWPDYQKEYGISQTDIPDLIRLATDKDLYLENTEKTYPENFFWGTIHAMRALGQLKATQAIEPLLGVLKASQWDDDSTLETLPYVFGLLGPEAIPFLKHALKEWYTQEYEPTASVTVEALEKIATNYAEAREEVVDILLQRLQTPEKNDESLNGFLINSLAELKAEKALPAIEAAFKQDLVDTMITRWHTVQHQLGLITQEEYDQAEEEARAAQRTRFVAERSSADSNDYDPFRGKNVSPSANKQKEKAKAKRKMAKASQKKNRKRK